MVGTTRRRGIAVIAAAFLGAVIAAGMVTTGARPVAAGTAHPCLPGETDVIGAFVKYLDGGSTEIEVWMCDDGGPAVPTPNVPWGSLTNGVPCAGPGTAIGKVRVDFDNNGVLLLVWMCAEEAPPPPQPGTVPAKRQSSSAPTPRYAPIGSPMTFQPIAPQRVLDTRRPGLLMLSAGETRRVDLSAALGATMAGAAVNITAADATAAGYLTVWDCGGARPGTSTVNFRAGGAAAAGAVVLVDAAHEFCVYSSAPTQLIVDVNGGYSTAGGFRFTNLAPRRIHDSRPAPIPAESVTVIRTGAPAHAAFLNVTAVAPDAAGFLTVWPCSIARPEVSNLNFPAGISAIANAVQIPVDPDGSVCVYNSASTGLLVDLLGVYDDSPTGTRYQATVPIRLMDTRVGTGGWAGTIGNGQKLDVTAPIPVALGMLGTVTLVDPPQAGFLTLAATSATSAPGYSTLNMTDTTIANMFVAGYTGALFPIAGPTGGEHVLIDIAGYFVA